MTFLSHTPNVGHLFRALLLLGTLWWAWSVALGCDSHRYGPDSQRSLESACAWGNVVVSQHDGLLRQAWLA
jgi:hypothetical protein